MEIDRPLIVASRSFDWLPVTIPDVVEPGKVRVRTLVSLISPGTELRLYRGEPMVEEVWDCFADIDAPTTEGMGVAPAYRITGHNEPSGAKYPVNCGYNLVGEVVEVGEGVGSLDVGDRVFALARHQPVFDAREWQAVKVPEGVSTEAAAFGYLPTLGLHALRRGGFTPGLNVAVIGLGLIGFGAALVADAIGAYLACLEISPARRRRAATALPRALVLDPTGDGFEEALMERFQPFGIDVVVEAAVGPAPLDLGMRILDDQGRMVAIALHPEDVGPLLSADFYNKQASILGTSNAPYQDPAERLTRFTCRSNIEFLLELHSKGRLALDAMHTDTYPAAEIDVAFSDLDAAERDMIGVLLDWR
jgi:hypothetical protein